MAEQNEKISRRKSSQDNAKYFINKTLMENEIDPVDVNFYKFQKIIGKGSFGKVSNSFPNAFATRIANVSITWCIGEKF